MRHEGGDNVEWNAMGYLQDRLKEHGRMGM
jgi:hypothetical protein